MNAVKTADALTVARQLVQLGAPNSTGEDAGEADAVYPTPMHLQKLLY